ncbi:ATP-binding protein [Pseudohongiella spirulinae]|uniref:Histidine kinase domain-containing protein n=1 Tax=Pseudohongiella spirulinae TaxID=1249552 RepID=A0A0S2KAL5_9GAMM|nr:ATP-binding protein [Pseudohongiella spirulinae]ALO45366.1 hypothetical protein PS2015_686 [Pseudohongiella spirulinae]
MILNDLYPYLILIGATILAVTAWLLQQANAQNNRGRELIKLNESLNFDLPDFLRDCWPLLNKGGFVGLRWDLDWFGTKLSGMQGQETPHTYEQQLYADDISLEISLFSAKSSWERRYFSRSLAESFFLLLRMDFWIKLGSIRSTFAQAAKMNVFLQHDIKNMLQLTSLAAEQILDPPVGQQQRLIAALQVSIPALRDRVELMLERLRQDKNVQVSSMIELSDYIRNSAQSYKLRAEISGRAQIATRQVALQSIIDNLLGNYADMAKKQPEEVSLIIQISSEERAIQITFSDQNADPCPWPERLFEPFWSEHGNGRGIGLYQARQSAIGLGGNLSIVAHPDRPLLFLLTLPAHTDE